MAVKVELKIVRHILKHNEGCLPDEPRAQKLYQGD